MDEATRRKFLIMAGIGAATTAGAAVAASTGIVAASTGIVAAPAGGEAPPAALPASASGPLVAYVEDVRAGRLAVLVGETEVVVRDPDLVARLSRAAAGRTA